MTFTRLTEGLPFVSVIMPVYNEGSFIERSLNSILNQSYPKDRMEIVIADGMSTDKTRSIISDVSSRSKTTVKIVDNPGKIAPTGLNCALRTARGEVVVRVDGHCEIDPDYVANCVALLYAGKAEGVGGPIETIGETAVARVIARAMSSPFGVGGSAFRTINDREMYTDTVAFPGYTRNTIDTVGYFDEQLVRNQDDEYNYRIRKMGGRILLSPKIRSRYYSRGTFRSLWRQYFQYGFWKVRVMQLHPGQMSLRQFVPFAFVIGLIALLLLSLVSPLGIIGLAALVVSYLLANLFASVLTCRTFVRQIPGVSLSFAILHFSYGLGFMIGIFSFFWRWIVGRVAIDVSQPDHSVDTPGSKRP
jgi:succinoglycan biosynthesis protein ExoA